MGAVGKAEAELEPPEIGPWLPDEFPGGGSKSRGQESHAAILVNQAMKSDHRLESALPVGLPHGSDLFFRKPKNLEGEGNGKGNPAPSLSKLFQVESLGDIMVENADDC